MSDPRYAKLARLLVNYSCALKKGENVLLDMVDVPDAMVVELMRATREAGACPIVEVRHSRIIREVQFGTDDHHATLTRTIELARMRKMQAYIAIRGAHNASETSDVPSEKTKLYAKALRPVLDHRVNKTRWVVLRWPTPSMAQSANMSTEAFEKFFFDVCTMDYEKMARAVLPLEKRMRAADRVQIKGPGTDLTFSIQGIGARPCEGLRNIPDGECFSCPTLKSSNGIITFNTPTIYAGTKFEGIRLEMRDGVIARATCQGGHEKKLNEILDMDPGARRIGEFSLGFNPYILSPMCDILFDEKIAGSLHYTPGQAYDDPGNGNKSAVHWDMVLIQRPEWGGGEVWFDGELIRRDGLFVPTDLKPLNPDRLK
jgi:aminopeptidase